MTTQERLYPPLSPLATGARCRCPRCGQGRLFSGYLTSPAKCDACGLDYDFFDSGDAPAVFVIFIVGFVVVGLALWVEMTWRPAYWVHAALWLPLILGLPLALLRPMKAMLLCHQYNTRAPERPDDGGSAA